MSGATAPARDGSLADLIGPGEKVFLTGPAAQSIYVMTAKKSNLRLQRSPTSGQFCIGPQAPSLVCVLGIGRQDSCARTRPSVGSLRGATLFARLRIEARSGIPQLIRNQQRRHQQKAIFTSLAELLHEAIELASHVVGQCDQPLLLAIAATQAVAAPVQRNRNLPHRLSLDPEWAILTPAESLIGLGQTIE